jgi:hypothetical protein
MNWNRYGRKRFRPNLRYYPGICVTRSMKATEASVRVVGILAEIQTEHILNTDH